MLPIEYVCDFADRRLARDGPHIASTDELWVCIKIIQNVLAQTDIKNMSSYSSSYCNARLATPNTNFGHLIYIFL